MKKEGFLGKYIFLLALIIVQSNSFGQYPGVLSTSSALKEQYLDKVKNETKEFLKADYGENDKEIKEHIKEREDYLEECIEKNIFLFDGDVDRLFSKILDEIARSNPAFDFSKIKVVLSNMYWPNAFSVGEGTIAFNVAIFKYFDSEDEMAFIFCHELAHYLKDHSIEAVNLYHSMLKSEEFKDKVDEIKKEEYGASSKLKELLKNNIYSQRAHSRDHELEADSFGYELFKKTSYCKMAALTAIEKLEEMNDEHFNSGYSVFNKLNLDTLPPSSATLDIKGDFSDFDDELIKSHPDVEKRLKRLTHLSGNPSCNSNESEEFVLAKSKMEAGMCESFMFYQRHGRALIYALRNMNSSDSILMKQMACVSYYKIVSARKSHDLSLMLPPPVGFKDIDYEYLLRAAYYTRLKNLEKSMISFCKSNFNENMKDENYLYQMGKMAFEFEEHEFFKDIKSSKRRNVGEIFSEGKITGYYLFYETDKVDRKTREYTVSVLNENLKEIAKEKIIESKNVQLLESIYNGSHLLFKFIDTKEKTISYRVMDSKGKISKPVTRETNKYELSIYINTLNAEGDFYSLSFPDDKGFMDVFPIKDKDYGYQATYINNDAEIDWDFVNTQDKGVLSGLVLYSSKDITLILESSTPSLLSKDVTFTMNAISSKGKSLFKTDLTSSRYNLFPHNVILNDETGNLTIIGEHYNKGDKVAKSESNGIFIRDIDLDGNWKTESYFSWDKEIKSHMGSADFKEFREFRLYFHKIVQTKDGNIIAVGEQYRKQVSALGVAANLLANANGGSTDASVFEMRIGDMVFIEISPKREIKKVEIFDKKNSSVYLAQSYTLVDENLLGRLMAQNGYLDFYFMQTNEDNSVYSFVFADRVEEDSKLFKEPVVQIVNYVDADKDFTKDQMKRKTKANSMIISRAKPGHILVVEYFRKEKRLEFKLEPINF